MRHSETTNDFLRKSRINQAGTMRSTRFIRITLFVFVCLFMLGAPTLNFSDFVEPVLAQSEAERVYLDRLAVENNIPPNQLEMMDMATIELVDGTKITRAVAVDRNNRVIGATFLGDKIVDEQEIRRQVAAEWRAQHGALTPKMVAKMADMGPQDTLEIAVWLAVEIAPLPKPDYTPPGSQDEMDPTDTTSPARDLEDHEGDETPAGPLPLDQVPESVIAKSRLVRNPGARLWGLRR